MSKYDPLMTYLEQSSGEDIPMGFSEIETVLGFGLPPSSRRQRAWWSNNPTNNVMTQAWLEAGFETVSVDMPGEKLTFRRKRKAVRDMSVSAKTAPSGTGYTKVHPAWGAMKGVLTLADDLDLTQPAEPEWAAVLEANYGRARD